MMDQASLDRRALMTALCVPLTLTVPIEAAATESDPDDLRRVLQSYANAWIKNDLILLQSFYHEEFALHYPGRHPLAGIHKGKQEALRVLREVGMRTNRKLIEVLDVMSGSQRACLNVTEQWTRGSDAAVVERVFIYTVRDGKLHQCWLFDADQEIVARYLRDQ
jgi:hypothetical protein